MNDLETLLRASLQREEPGAGFVERVQLRIEQQRRRRSRVTRWLAAAAFLFVCSGGWLYQEHMRKARIEGEIAKAEALQALRISSEKLNLALRKINHLHEPKEKS